MVSLARMKSFLLAKGMRQLVPLLSSHAPDTLLALMDKMSARGIERMRAAHQGTPEELENRVQAARALFDMAKRQLPRLSRNTQKALAFNTFFNAINLGDEKREEYRARHGEYPPFFLLMSPSMACDLRCVGCYAWKHPRDESLSREKVSAIITEAKNDMGIYFYSYTGGEPTYWPPLEEIAREHDDCFFMCYTHGQRIDEATARRWAELGNLFPAISIEGDEALTDRRRGPGAWRNVMQAMERLRQHGVLFGFSLTHSRLNHDFTVHGGFVDDMIARGAAFGWVFQYLPIGRDPDFGLAPTAAQRLERREMVRRAREGKPILIYDFWNDGDAVDGCIAWGRKYAHITAKGWVEPCVFVHFAKDSLHQKTLGEALRSDCFREARALQPFTHDLRRPCPQIDHPGILRGLVERHGLVPTHPGAEDIIGAHFGPLCQTASDYAAELAREDARLGVTEPKRDPRIESGGDCGCGVTGCAGCRGAGTAKTQLTVNG